MSVVNYKTLRNIFDLTGNGIPERFDENKHTLLYIIKMSLYGKPKIGKTNRIHNKTYKEAMDDRYAQTASGRDEPIDLYYLYLIPKNKDKNKDFNYDTDFRNLLNEMHKLHPDKYKQYCPHNQGDGDEFKNSERVENWNIDNFNDFKIVHDLIYLWVEGYFQNNINIVYNDERREFKFRGEIQEMNFWKAQDIIRKCCKVLINGHTADGKTYLVPKHIVELHKYLAEKENVGIYDIDGIHIFLTSAVDTQRDIIDNVKALNYGANIITITDFDIKQKGFENKIINYKKNNIILCVFTVHNLRYDDDDRNSDEIFEGDIKKAKNDLRDKFKFLKNFNIISLTRDERHKEYDAIITKQTVSCIKRLYTFDLSATITDLLKNYSELYDKSEIVRNPLSNMLMLTKSGHSEYDGYIKEFYIEMFNFNSDMIPDKLKNVFKNYKSKRFYSLNTSTMKFDLEDEIIEYHRLLYDGIYNFFTVKIKRNKVENPFAIYSDSDLKNTDVILHVLPRGEGKYTATDIQNEIVKFYRGKTPRVFRRDAYTAEEIKNMMGKGFKSNEKILLELVDNAKNNGKDGIIIFTHRKLILGVNLPPLSIIVCDDIINSVVVFEQLIGRAVRKFIGIDNLYESKNAAKIYINHPGMSLKTIAAMKHELILKSVDNKNELKLISENILPISYYDITKCQVTFQEQFEAYQEELYNKFLNKEILSANDILDIVPDLENQLKDFEYEYIKNNTENIEKLKMTDKLTDKNKKNIKDGEGKNKNNKSKRAETITSIINEMIFNETKWILIKRGKFK